MSTRPYRTSSFASIQPIGESVTPVSKPPLEQQSLPVFLKLTGASSLFLAYLGRSAAAGSASPLMKLLHILTSISLVLTGVRSARTGGSHPAAPNRRPRPLPKQPAPDTKYFHEPGASDELGHYDIRYYQGSPVSYEERGETLHHLIRSYLMTFRERNIETWIAHGTLLGWWWNGKIMPWDWDLDTQVSAATLTWLGNNMNMTTHKYNLTNPGGEAISREYLLDVNPNIVQRVRGDGMNVIDARWIDIRNGLFIDITGLSETNPSTQPGIWSCKNFHRYRTRDLYPLRESEFEGVPALVPYSFDRVLSEEYSARALTKTMHQGHRWVPEQKEWVKVQPVKKPEIAKPHVPRSLQPEGNPRTGLRNLGRIFS